MHYEQAEAVKQQRKYRSALQALAVIASILLIFICLALAYLAWSQGNLSAPLGTMVVFFIATGVCGLMYPINERLSLILFLSNVLCTAIWLVSRIFI